MRKAHKVWGGIAAGVFSLVAISDLSTPDVATPVATTATAATGPAAAPAAPAPVAAPARARAAAPAASARRATPAAPSPRTVTVSEVLDGDTFVAGGQKVRVLGIDSCEMSTYGGKQAKATAEDLLDGQQVTLRTQPGVDRDRYGRQLRYVDLSYGADYAESIVIFNHTGVYTGRNDAPASYVQKLRDTDPNGRSCSAPAPVTTGSGDTDDTDSGSINLPTPGDQGMRDGALTGGYCKKKWWC